MTTQQQPPLPDDVWSWLNANAGAVGVIATVLTALIAVLALQQTVRDSRERTRAYVGVEVVPASKSGFSAVLRVVNFGQSVARDVVVSFTQPLQPRDQQDTIAAVQRRYAGSLPNLSPGQELKNTWQTWSDRGPLSSAPERCTATVTYRSGQHRRRYTEEFVLDLRTIGAESDPVASNSELGTLRRIAQSLEQLATKGE